MRVKTWFLVVATFVVGWACGAYENEIRYAVGKVVYGHDVANYWMAPTEMDCTTWGTLDLNGTCTVSGSGTTTIVVTGGTQ